MAYLTMEESFVGIKKNKKAFSDFAFIIFSCPISARWVKKRKT